MFDQVNRQTHSGGGIFPSLESTRSGTGMPPGRTILSPCPESIWPGTGCYNRRWVIWLRYLAILFVSQSVRQFLFLLFSSISCDCDGSIARVDGGVVPRRTLLSEGV